MGQSATSVQRPRYGLLHFRYGWGLPSLNLALEMHSLVRVSRRVPTPRFPTVERSFNPGITSSLPRPAPASRCWPRQSRNDLCVRKPPRIKDAKGTIATRGGIPPGFTGLSRLPILEGPFPTY